MRVLEITSELDGGGVDRLLYDYCSRLADIIHFDFVVTSKFKGILEEPLEDLGFSIYHISQLRDSYKEHCEQLNNIMKKNHYDIVHDHSGYKAAPNLKIAKKNGVKGRIAHAHIAFVPETKKQMLKRIMATPLTKMEATELFACGIDAGKWMWGSSTDYIMKNAIDTNRFLFNIEKRNALRKYYNVEDRFIIGNVARMSYQKNHEYLVHVFHELKKIKSNAFLVLVGQGELEEDIKRQVVDLGLASDVLFMGVRNDVPDLLNMFDVFVLPSRYEGLPVSLVEVQANGLPAFVSSAVTKEIAVSDFIHYFDLIDGPAEWAKRICESNMPHIEYDMSCSEYDINNSTKSLYERYQKYK